MLPVGPARPEAGQERFERKLGLGDRPEPAFFHVQSDGPMLSRYRLDERAQDGAAVRMVVLVVAIRVEALEWFSVVDRADHEQVIRVEDERKILSVAALDLWTCPQPERHEAVAVDGRGVELDDFVVGREAELLEVLEGIPARSAPP